MSDNMLYRPGLRRALLTTMGAWADEVAEQALALSQEWLGAAPPLAVERLDSLIGGEGDPGRCLATLAAACDRLAAAETATMLGAAGWSIAQPDEITAWLLVDVSEAELPPADTGAMADAPAGGSCAGAPEALDAWGRLLPALQEAAWRRLRVHVVWHALLLAEPAQEALAATWAQRLAAAGVERIAVGGPVDEGRLRWPQAAWQARAAAALVALLWSEAALEPKPADAAGGWAWGVAAAAWPSPAAVIAAQAMWHCAAMTVHRLLAAPAAEADAQTPPWEAPGLSITPERHRLALQTAVPAEPPPLAWSRCRPAALWTRLAGLPADLADAAAAHTAAARDAQYVARGEWLTGQVDAWEAALLRLRAERLAPAAGWPTLSRYQMELQALIVQLRVACETVEEWLEAAGQEYARAETAVRQAQQTLTRRCCSFPAPRVATVAFPADGDGADALEIAGASGTVEGLLGLLLRPWRWPRLLWNYLIALPAACQRYLNAVGRQGEARRQEANTHALRQTYLAMTQAVQERQAEAETYAQQLAIRAALLAERLAALTPLSPPWDDGWIAALAAAGLPDHGPGLPDLLAAPGAGSDETGQSGASQDDPCLANLLAWAAEHLSFLGSWTAADYLTAAASKTQLASWLARLAAAARPLWPAVGREAPATAWLLWPDRRAGAAEPGSTAEEQLRAQFLAWAAQTDQRPLMAQTGICAPDVLLVFRSVAVDLFKEET